MSRDNLFILVIGLAIINGIFNRPGHILMLNNLELWYPYALIPLNPTIVTYLSSLAISSLTLILAGIPAALSEHAFRAEESSIGSMCIWVLGVLALTYPAFELLFSKQA
jgi:hypothetical protein